MKTRRRTTFTVSSWLCSGAERSKTELCGLAVVANPSSLDFRHVATHLDLGR